VAENVKDTIDIEASVDDIFEIATDLEAYPDWNTNIKKVEVKETDDEGRPVTAWFEVDAKIKVVTYTLAYDYSDAPNGFSWELVDGDVKDLAGSYLFDEFDDVTEVTYEMRIDPGFPVPGFLRRQAEKQIVRGALDDLKKRVEGS
jgi:uncharacterized membrane protein